MKKMFTAFMMAIALFAASSAQAQVKLGVKGGLNVTSMSLDSKVLNTSNRAGFFIGPTIKFTLPIVGLGIDASALYDQRDAKIKYNNNGAESSNTIKHQSIMIPINVRYGIGLGSAASVFAFAGPQFGFNVGSKNQDLVKDVAGWRLKESNFSINLGLGVSVLKHLQVTANYNIACGKTGEANVLNTGTQLAKDLLGDSKTNAWQIALAYYF